MASSKHPVLLAPAKTLTVNVSRWLIVSVVVNVVLDAGRDKIGLPL